MVLVNGKIVSFVELGGKLFQLAEMRKSKAADVVEEEKMLVSSEETLTEALSESDTAER